MTNTLINIYIKKFTYIFFKSFPIGWVRKFKKTTWSSGVKECRAWKEISSSSIT